MLCLWNIFHWRHIVHMRIHLRKASFELEKLYGTKIWYYDILMWYIGSEHSNICSKEISTIEEKYAFWYRIWTSSVYVWVNNSLMYNDTSKLILSWWYYWPVEASKVTTFVVYICNILVSYNPLFGLVFIPHLLLHEWFAKELLSIEYWLMGICAMYLYEYCKS